MKIIKNCKVLIADLIICLCLKVKLSVLLDSSAKNVTIFYVKNIPSNVVQIDGFYIRTGSYLSINYLCNRQYRVSLKGLYNALSQLAGCLFLKAENGIIKRSVDRM